MYTKLQISNDNIYELLKNPIILKHFLNLKQKFLKRYGGKIATKFLQLFLFEYYFINLNRILLDKNKALDFTRKNLNYLMELNFTTVLDLIFKIFIIATNYKFQEVAIKHYRNQIFLRKVQALHILARDLYTSHLNMSEFDFLFKSLQGNILSRFFNPHSKKDYLFGEKNFFQNILYLLEIIENQKMPKDHLVSRDFRNAGKEGFSPIIYDYNIILRLKIKEVIQIYNLDLFNPNFKFWYYLHSLKPKKTSRRIKGRLLIGKLKNIKKKMVKNNKKKIINIFWNIPKNFMDGVHTVKTPMVLNINYSNISNAFPDEFFNGFGGTDGCQPLNIKYDAHKASTHLQDKQFLVHSVNVFQDFFNRE